MRKFTTTLQSLMDMNTETKSISSVEDSHASHLAVLEGARALVMNVRYSQKFSEFYGKRMPDGSWAKTCQDSLQLMEDNTSVKSSMTWPKLGMALDGLCTGQKTLVLFTEGTGFSSLPTPRTCSAMGAAINPASHLYPKLETVIARELLATPRASQDYKPIRQLSPSEADGTHGRTLVADIGSQLLPTPTVQDAKNNGSESQQKRNTKPLNAVAINISLEETGNNGESPLRLGLNPEFVEAMMGFPIGWTDLSPSETP